MFISYNGIVDIPVRRTFRMNDGSLQEAGPVEQELLYFWAFGDLHYRACDRWHAIHSRRLEPMFRDVRSLWLDEGSPAFCVSPGDIVDTGTGKLPAGKKGPCRAVGQCSLLSRHRQPRVSP